MAYLWSQVNSYGEDGYICMGLIGLFISIYTKVSFENPQIREKSINSEFSTSVS